jgi:hypothetical protein
LTPREKRSEAVPEMRRRQSRSTSLIESATEEEV